jgi:hypothetical protein
MIRSVYYPFFSVLFPSLGSLWFDVSGAQDEIIQVCSVFVRCTCHVRGADNLCIWYFYQWCWEMHLKTVLNYCCSISSLVRHNVQYKHFFACVFVMSHEDCDKFDFVCLGKWDEEHSSEWSLWHLFDVHERELAPVSADLRLWSSKLKNRMFYLDDNISVNVWKLCKQVSDSRKLCTSLAKPSALQTWKKPISMHLHCIHTWHVECLA